jgi:hypothetical protein
VQARGLASRLQKKFLLRNLCSVTRHFKFYHKKTGKVEQPCR